MTYLEAMLPAVAKPWDGDGGDGDDLETEMAMTETAEMTSQMKRQRTQNSWPTSLEGSFLMKPRWLIPLHLRPPAAGGNRNPHLRKGSFLISSSVAAAD